MKSELVDIASEVVRDPQILINLVSKRVKQLNGGRAPFIKTVPSMGAADIALMEIIEGKIIPKGIEIFPLPKPDPEPEEEKKKKGKKKKEKEESSAEVIEVSSEKEERTEKTPESKD